MRNMNQRDALVMKNYILGHQKLIFKNETFSCEIGEKKISLKLDNRIG